MKAIRHWVFASFSTASRFFLIILSCCLFAPCLTPVAAQRHTNDRARWFVDDRFGMFIHWGLYSGAEGIWKGEPLRHDNQYAEWIQYRNRIEKKEYATTLSARIDWQAIDPEAWVLLAKEAGMKYVTLTAKHHDGFALWNSEASDYNVANYSNPKRDIVAELARACRKHGLKLGLYYSHWVDWEHPYGWDHSRELYPLTAAQYDTYWQEKVLPQMRELLTKYGDIGLFWFDMWIHHSESIVSKGQLEQLKNLIRELQPECLINSRLGLSVPEDPDVDFRTLGDNELGVETLEYPWQTPGTVAHSWGFNAYEDQWKSTTSLLKALIGNTSMNGNFMLNIGPRANGDVPFETSARLREMGRWLAVNGEAIYGSGGFGLRQDLHDWGTITYKKDATGNHRLFLHIATWPLNRSLFVTGITTRPDKAYVLADKSREVIPLEHQGALTTLTLPEVAPDPYVSVVVLEYEEAPELQQGLVPRAGYGGYALQPANAVSIDMKGKTAGPDRMGTVPEHLLVKEPQTYTWKVYLPEPGTYEVEASYSFQGKSDKGSIRVEMAEIQLEQPLKPTGKTVGEPRQDWVIDSFEALRLGKIPISEAGYYDIVLRIWPEGKEAIKFQWLWLQKTPK